MKAPVIALLLMLTLITAFGGIISSIWLAILGEWWTIGYGLVTSLFSPLLIIIAMMPGPCHHHKLIDAYYEKHGKFEQRSSD